MSSVPDRPAQRSPLLRFWWIWPVALLLGAFVVALTNREVPLGIENVGVEVHTAIDAAPATGRPPPIGKYLIVSQRTFTPPGESPIDSTVKTTIERLDGQVVRRADDWYQLQGQRPVLEQRTLSWRGLVSLHRVERHRAPLFHDILGNHGWRATHTHDLRLRADASFPAQPGSRLTIESVRSTETAIARPGGVLPAQRRSTECKVEGERPAASLLAGWSGSLPVVVCGSSEVSVDKPAITLQARTEYVYLTQHDLFIPIASDEDEPVSPLATDPTPQQSKTRVRLVSFEFVPGAAR